MAGELEDSILTSIKAALGLPEDHEVFDTELIIHINSALANLTQLGVGPAIGFAINDKTTKWSGLLDTDVKLSNVRSYVFLKVKLVFDSSNMTQALLSAYEKLLVEETWRIQVAADPMIPQLVPEIDPDDPYGDGIILDGGGA